MTKRVMGATLRDRLQIPLPILSEIKRINSIPPEIVIKPMVFL